MNSAPPTVSAKLHDLNWSQLVREYVSTMKNMEMKLIKNEITITETGIRTWINEPRKTGIPKKNNK